LEITAYQSGAILEDGTERRPVENEWERLKLAADTFRRQNNPELREINAGLMFRGKVPPRRDHAAFLDEIATFALTHLGELTAEDRAYWPSDLASPVMQAYLRTLYLRKDQYPEWYSNIPAGFVDRPGHGIAAIVAEKSKRKYRPVDELWLVIQCGTRISEMMLDIMGVEDFEAVPSLDGFAFSRVFVLPYTGAYEWQRGKGWRRLTGQSPVADGVPFDAMKAVLADPEWLNDPDRKAHDVAIDCVRQFREGAEET
jgi:hypothetical protein